MQRPPIIVPQAFEFCICTFSVIDSISTKTNQFQTIAIKLCCSRHVLSHFFPQFFVGIFFFNIFYVRMNILAGIVYNNQYTIDILEYKTKLPRVFLRFFSNRFVWHFFTLASTRVFFFTFASNSSHCFNYCVHIIACQCTLYFVICLCVCQ